MHVPTAIHHYRKDPVKKTTNNVSANTIATIFSEWGNPTTLISFCNPLYQLYWPLFLFGHQPCSTNCLNSSMGVAWVVACNEFITGLKCSLLKTLTASRAEYLSSDQLFVVRSLNEPGHLSKAVSAAKRHRRRTRFTHHILKSIS